MTTIPGHATRSALTACVQSSRPFVRLVWSIPPNPLRHDDLHFGLQPTAGAKMIEIEPRPASVEEIMLVHPRRHVERVRVRSEYGGLLDSGDTAVGPGSYEAALLAAGACLRCVDGVLDGEFKRAFVAVRPPGHHAEPNAAMGFCLFSNTAIAARHAQRNRGVGRIAIVDFDVHHGNGTQAEFQTDPSVLFISLHEDPHTLFPHSGYAWEIGGRPRQGLHPELADGAAQQRCGLLEGNAREGAAPAPQFRA